MGKKDSSIYRAWMKIRGCRWLVLSINGREGALSEILPFEKDKFTEFCGFCKNKKVKKNKDGLPAYCSPDCAIAGQAQFVLRSGNKGDKA